MKGLYRIFITHSHGWDRIRILLFLFLVVLIPKIFFNIVMPKPHLIINAIVVVFIAIFMSDYFLMRLKNPWITIVFIGLLIIIGQFVIYISFNRLFYGGIFVVTIRYVSLLVFWKLLAERKLHFLLVMFLGYLISDILATSTHYLYYMIFEDYSRNLVIVLGKFQFSLIVFIISTLVLYFVFGINKLIKPKNTNGN